MTVKFKSDYDARTAMEKAEREIDNATTQAKEVLVGHRRAVNSALSDQMVPPSGRAYRVGELRKQASQKLLDIESEARAAVKAAAEAADYLARDQRSVGEQTRDDGRMRLAFERARLLLDAGTPAHQVVSRAVESGDKDTIRAMEFFAKTHLEASVLGRGGNVGDYRQQFDALDRTLKEAKRVTGHPAETVLGDLSAGADAVALITTRARQEVQGGEPVVALHVEGADFSDTVDVARENATLLSRMGGGDAARRAS